MIKLEKVYAQIVGTKSIELSFSQKVARFSLLYSLITGEQLDKLSSAPSSIMDALFLTHFFSQLHSHTN